LRRVGKHIILAKTTANCPGPNYNLLFIPNLPFIPMLIIALLSWAT
jgi:hypothetical protein